MGSARALETVKRRDVVVGAMDFSKDLEQAIRDWLIAGTVTQQTITMGRVGVQIARNVVGGSGPCFP